MREKLRGKHVAEMLGEDVGSIPASFHLLLLVSAWFALLFAV